MWEMALPALQSLGSAMSAGPSRAESGSSSYDPWTNGDWMVNTGGGGKIAATTDGASLSWVVVAGLVVVGVLLWKR